MDAPLVFCPWIEKQIDLCPLCAHVVTKIIVGLVVSGFAHVKAIVHGQHGAGVHTCGDNYRQLKLTANNCPLNNTPDNFMHFSLLHLHFVILLETS